MLTLLVNCFPNQIRVVVRETLDLSKESGECKLVSIFLLLLFKV